MSIIENPDKMTDEQIEKVLSMLRSAMQERRSEIPSDIAQRTIEIENLGNKLFESFAGDAEPFFTVVTRTVEIDPKRSQASVIEALCRTRAVADRIPKLMPRSEETKLELVFFKPKMYFQDTPVSDRDILAEYEQLDLNPADPISVMEFNERYPSFTDRKSHCTHWISNGKLFRARFTGWNGGRQALIRPVRHHRNGKVRDENARLWFVGVRK
jgi:hypothetical protein